LLNKEIKPIFITIETTGYVFLIVNNFIKTLYMLDFVQFLLHSIHVLDVIFITIDTDNSSTISLDIP
jgi:hypothetical protein